MGNKLYILFMIFGMLASWGQVSLADVTPSQFSEQTLESNQTQIPERNPFKPQLPIKKITPPTTQTAILPPKIDQNIATKQPEKKPESQPKASVPTPSIVITGLVWDTNRPQAIINGQVVDEGDTISELKIVSIKKTGIDINFQGQTITVIP